MLPSLFNSNLPLRLIVVDRFGLKSFGQDLGDKIRTAVTPSTVKGV